MKIMYAITHVNKDGMRTLALANQGRYHYATWEDAERALDLLREGLVNKVGLNDLEIRAVECYSHGDAIGIWFD